jgi:hypothetical protein
MVLFFLIFGWFHYDALIYRTGYRYGGAGAHGGIAENPASGDPNSSHEVKWVVPNKCT